MTRDDIIRMAREAGFSEWAVRTPQDLERFATLVAAAEREACAKVCEGEIWIEGKVFDCNKPTMQIIRQGADAGLEAAAAAIRARSQK
jgi:hypothetical protein